MGRGGCKGPSMTMTAMSLKSERAIAHSDEKRRVVTLKEMAEHATAEDCWIAISGEVRRPSSVFSIFFDFFVRSID